MRILLLGLSVVGALAIALALLFATGVARLAWNETRAGPATVPPVVPAPAPSPAPATAPTPTPPDATGGVAAAVPAAPRPQAMITPDARPAIAPGAGGAGANEINEPDGEHVLGPLDNGTRLTLTGRVGTLRVMGVNGGSVLDASGLHAGRVVFAGEVNGGSTVKVFASGGTIRFEAGVNGLSRVRADAPGGTVTFARGDKGGKGAGEINGESALSVTAARVEFDAPINGTSTKIDVTTTGAGVIRFRTLEGGSRISYRKADPADPDPHVEAGTVAVAARVEKGE